MIIPRYAIPAPGLGPRKGPLSRTLHVVAHNNTATHLHPPRILWIERSLVEASIYKFLWQCDKFCGAELHINRSTLEIVRVPSFSPAATTFPLAIYHTTTTMSREALRPRNLNVYYLPPPLLLPSPPSSPKNVKKQSAKRHIMDNDSGPKHSSSQPPPPPTVVHHRPVIIPDVSSLTTEAPPAMLNLDDDYSSSDEAYIEPAGSITAGHSVKQCKKALKKLIQNLPDLPKLPTFDPLQPVVPPHKAWKRLPISFSELDAITPT